MKGELMKMYPNNWEIYSDDLTELIAEFKAVEEDIITVTVKDAIMNPEDLKELSKCLEKAYEQYTEPDKKEN